MELCPPSLPPGMYWSLRRFSTGILRERKSNTFRKPESLTGAKYFVVNKNICLKKAQLYSGNHEPKSPTRWVELSDLVS